MVAPRRVRPRRAGGAAPRSRGRAHRRDAGARSTSSPPTTPAAAAARASRCSTASWPATASTRRTCADVDLEPVRRRRPSAARRAAPRGARAARRARRARSPTLDAGAAGLRLPQPAGARPGAAPRGVGAQRPGQVDDGRGLARPPAGRERPSIDDVVLRYLAAFGPATAADMADVVAADRLPRGASSGCARAADVPRRAGPRAASTSPTRPLPDPDVPAPARFLPEYDNVLLSHADRSRFTRDDVRRAGDVDGRSTARRSSTAWCAATWASDRHGTTAVDDDACATSPLAPGPASPTSRPRPTAPCGSSSRTPPDHRVVHGWPSARTRRWRRDATAGRRPTTDRSCCDRCATSCTPRRPAASCCSSAAARRPGLGELAVEGRPTSSSGTPTWRSTSAATSLDLDLQDWVNDGLMAIFFFVVGLEIKRELVEGELREPRRAALPAIAAVGGMVVPAADLRSPSTPAATGADGWGIPMATDIAMAVGVLSLLGARVRPVAASCSCSPWPSSTTSARSCHRRLLLRRHRPRARWPSPASLVVAVAVARRAGVQAHRGRTSSLGVGALAGPARVGRARHARRRRPRADGADAADPPARADRRRRADRRLDGRARPRDRGRSARESVSVVEWLEHLLHPWTSFVIVPLFALANAGVPSPPTRCRRRRRRRSRSASSLGLVVGKLVGITAFTWLAARLGIGVLPAGATLAGHRRRRRARRHRLHRVALRRPGSPSTTPASQDEAKIGILVASSSPPARLADPVRRGRRAGQRSAQPAGWAKLTG